MKKIIILMAVISMAVGLTACGQTGGSPEVTTIAVAKDGSVMHTIISPFDEEKYNAQELQTWIQEETDAYNEEQGENGITFVSQELNEYGVIFLKFKYASAKDYEAFNNKFLFVGTVKEAMENGYVMDVPMKNKKDQSLDETKRLELTDKHVLITEENNVNVKVFGKVLYFSNNVSVNGKNNVIQAPDEAKHYLIFE